MDGQIVFTSIVHKPVGNGKCQFAATSEVISQGKSDKEAEMFHTATRKAGGRDGVEDIIVPLQQLEWFPNYSLQIPSGLQGYGELNTCLAKP